MLGALEKIGEPCQSPFNAGFLTHLYALRTQDLVYVYIPESDSVNQPLSAVGIKTGAVITEFLIKTKTATFSESMAENADGVAFQTSLSFPMKGPAPELTHWVHKNRKRRYLLLLRDTMGNCYMMGNYDNGARVSWNRQVTSQSSHQFAFNLVNWHPIQFLPSIDLEKIFPNREFDYSFDLSFS